MRLYHFVPPNFGLEDLGRRQLKVALIDDLNDPFDLRAFGVANPLHRALFESVRAGIARKQGMLCFSKDWRNPVQWSHYADRHRGICMAFDVDDAVLTPVSYSNKRVYPDPSILIKRDAEAFELMRRGLSTKYSHWRYEKEVRVFVDLDKDEVDDEGRYFVDFSRQLILREVIVGATSSITRGEIREALGSLAQEVGAVKARLAFGSFRVVRQRMESLWR